MFLAFALGACPKPDSPPTSNDGGTTNSADAGDQEECHSSTDWAIVNSSELSGKIGDDLHYLLTRLDGRGGGVTQETAGDNTIAFVPGDPNNGWAVGHSGEVVRIQRKSNGNADATLSSFDLSTGELASVAPVDANQVWIAGKDSQNGGASIFVTDNGGQNWTASTTTAITFPSDNRTDTASDRINALVAAADGLHVLAVGRLGYGTALILRTADGGKNWASDTLDTLALPADSQLESVTFADMQTGYASGYHGTILKTVDGGEHWSKLSPNVSGSIHAIRCKDSQNCIAVGDSNVLLKTIDGGANWTSIHPPSGKSIDWAALFIADQEVWIGGSDATIAHSADFGANWITQTVGRARKESGQCVTFTLSAQVRSIVMLDAHYGWAVCANSSSNTGAVLRKF